MATATADAYLTQVTGGRDDIPAVASDIIYEGSAVGDNGSGYGRPLTSGDVFRGHCLDQCDNSSGSAGDKNIKVLTGRYRLVVALVGTITDVGRPVYMSDDTTYTFAAPDNSYVGVVKRYVSSTKMEIECRTGEFDEFGPNTQRETKSDDYTVDAQDSGKIIYVDTDAKTITLPATDAGIKVTFVNAGSFGTVALTISPNANDQIAGVDLTAADNKDIVNTKATAQRGDFVTLEADGTDGWMVTAMRGTWAREA